MAGTRAGGIKARNKCKSIYGKDYYARIGSMGGKLGKTGGFASPEKGSDGLTGRQRARVVGQIGGRISRRGPVKLPAYD